MKASMRVNGVERSADVEPRVLLADFLRTNLVLSLIKCWARCIVQARMG